MTRLWLQDSVAAKKPMTLNRRIEAVLYRPLPYSLPVPAFRAKVAPHLTLNLEPEPKLCTQPLARTLTRPLYRAACRLDLKGLVALQPYN